MALVLTVVTVVIEELVMPSGVLVTNRAVSPVTSSGRTVIKEFHLYNCSLVEKSLVSQVYLGVASPSV